MIVWRISDYPSLDGTGGRMIPGRWHNAGRPIVYCAEVPTLAMIEALVHLAVKNLPSTFGWMKIEIPDDLSYSAWPDDKLLPDLEETRGWGDGWLADAKTAIARVPTVVAPSSFNWLLNPGHKEFARIVLIDQGRWPWDERLFR